jgi:hypothetical protein
VSVRAALREKRAVWMASPSRRLVFFSLLGVTLKHSRYGISLLFVLVHPHESRPIYDFLFVFSSRHSF